MGKGISARVIPACESKTGRITEAEFYRNDILEIIDVSEVYIDELEIRGDTARGGKVYAFYKYFHPAHIIEKGTSYEWQGSEDGDEFFTVKKLGEERTADIYEKFPYKYIRVRITLANGKEYFSKACEIKDEEKAAENKYVNISLNDIEIECEKGKTYPVSWLALYHADSVILKLNKGVQVLADGCTVYSSNLSDEVQYVILKETCERIEIKVLSDYNGYVKVYGAAAAIKKQGEEDL